MAAAYIDTTYVDTFIGSDVRQALFTEVGSTYSSSAFTQVVNAASQVVKMAAKNAGYSLGDTTTDQTVMLATMVEFLKMAPGARKGFPIAEKLVEEYGGTMEAIRSGNLPLDQDPSAQNAVGGIVFTNSDETDPTARSAVFTRERFGSYY